jgi:hypothetical protein
MTKRKTKSTSKSSRSPKIVAKAQRANHAVVRSPREGRMRSVTADSSGSLPKREQEVSLGENLMAAFQADNKQPMKNIVSGKGFELSTAKVRAYQEKLGGVAQDNVQLALEYGQRLATIRSPVEIITVIVEFTSKRITMFQRHLKEMVDLTT